MRPRPRPSRRKPTGLSGRPRWLGSVHGRSRCPDCALPPQACPVGALSPHPNAGDHVAGTQAVRVFVVAAVVTNVLVFPYLLAFHGPELERR